MNQPETSKYDHYRKALANLDKEDWSADDWTDRTLGGRSYHGVIITAGPNRRVVFEYSNRTVNHSFDFSQELLLKKSEEAKSIVFMKNNIHKLIDDVERLSRIVEQHDLCHDLHGKVDAQCFAKGCEAEQRRIYGEAPHADEIVKLQNEIERLKHIVDAKKTRELIQAEIQATGGITVINEDGSKAFHPMTNGPLDYKKHV